MHDVNFLGYGALGYASSNLFYPSLHIFFSSFSLYFVNSANASLLNVSHSYISVGQANLVQVLYFSIVIVLVYF